MEHIMQFAISVDDETIKKRVEESAYNDILKHFIEEAEKVLPHSNFSRKVNWEYLVSLKLEEFCKEHKEEIIAAAAENLAGSVRRSKAFREKVKAITEET